MNGMLRKNTQRDIARRSSEISIKPTAEGAYYRFRLLSFPPDEEFVKAAGLTYYRDYHFLPRHMHVVWTEEPSDRSPTGVRKVRHTIPCPRSEYIRVNSNLTGKACPICNAGNQALKAYTDSGKRNQVAKKKWLDCRDTFEALIPVYVVNDPNNDAINGNVKVWRVNEEQYKRIVAIVNEAERGKVSIWNDNAVDLYFSYGEVEKSRTNKKTGETKTWKQNDIMRLGLTTTEHKIDGLDEMVKALNFDATWFTIPTMDELQDFYAKYIASTPAGALNDIPNDIPSDIPAAAPAMPTVKQAIAKEEFPELDSIPAKPIAEEKPKAKPQPEPAIDDIPPVIEKKAPEAPKAEATDAASDIDAFISGFKL